MISLESLIFAFKETNFLEEFKLHHETYALRQAKVSKVTDSDLLKSVLPEEIFVKMFGLGHLNLLAFVFALRHKILELNCLFHLSALRINQDPLVEFFKEEFFQLYGPSFLRNFYQLNFMLQPSFWSPIKKLPILGFSSLGCHFVLREVHFCRAFDAYHLPYCKNIARGVFCDLHIAECFWKKPIYENASIQAKLAQFYMDTHNYSQFDEDSLKNLINNFFEHFEKYKKASVVHGFGEEKLKFLLNFYSFSSVEDLKKEGNIELRRRFLELAKQFHPDMGGAHESFREARENYEYLREILSK
jgi:hypothetical protein